MSNTNYASNLNGYPLKDAEAREQLNAMELSKASHTDLENAMQPLNSAISNLSNDLDELETLFNQSGLSNAAENLSYDNTDSKLSAVNVQDAIDELNEKIGNSEGAADAENISYNNTDSKLAAENVQDAITELKSLNTVGYDSDSDYLTVMKDGEMVTTPIKVGLLRQVLFSANNNEANFDIFNGSTTPGMILLSPSVSFGEVMRITLTTAGWQAGSVISGEKYDLTNVSKIVLDFSATSSGATSYDYARLFVTQAKTESITSLATSNIIYAQSTNSGVIELDVSSVSGICYVGIELSANAKTITVDVNDFYLE